MGCARPNGGCMIPGITAGLPRGSSGAGEYAVDVTVPAASVTANLPGFPVYIDLADFPSGIWSHIGREDGGDIRVEIAGSPVPFDIVKFNKDGRKGGVFVKADLSSSAGTVIRFRYGDPGRARLPVTDTNGRNAVWAAYERVSVFCGDVVDRTGKGANFTASATPPQQGKVVSISPNTYSHQGVAWDGTYYYTVDTNAIYKWDASWSLVATNSNPIASVPGTNHCGDPEKRGGYLYIPIESYTSATVWSNQNIARFNADDLSFVDATNISAQNHECSTICWSDALSCFIVGSYAHDTTLFKYAADLSYLGTITLSASITSIQGITSMGGQLYINSDSGNRTILVELDGTVGATVVIIGGGTYEGISHKDGNLLVLVDGGTPARFVREIEVGGFSASGIAVFAGAAAYVGAGAANFTTWTMGASARLASASGSNKGIVTYGNATSGTDSIRASMLFRQSTNRFAIWNSTNTFLEDTAAPALNTHYRLHAYHEGTAGRGLYRDGVLVASAASSAARPSALGDALHVGQDDSSALERWNGDIGFVYLINAVLPQAWLAAETLNIKTPSLFYSVGSEGTA